MTYSFTFASGKGRSGWSIPWAPATTWSISGTVAEFTAFSSSVNLGELWLEDRQRISRRSVGATEAAIVSLGYSTAFVIPALSTTFQLTDVADRQPGHDRVAHQRPRSNEQAHHSRGLNIANNGSLAVLDFNAAEAFAPGAGTVTVTGLGADHASILALYTGTYGSTFGLISSIDDYTTGAVAFSAVPVASLSATELQQLIADAQDASNANSARGRCLLPARRPRPSRWARCSARQPSPRWWARRPMHVHRCRASQASYNRLFTASYDHQGLANRSATMGTVAGTSAACPPPGTSRCPTCGAAVEHHVGTAGWDGDQLGCLGPGRRHPVPRWHHHR